MSDEGKVHGNGHKPPLITESGLVVHKPQHGGELHLFPKGRSGNPSGRPRKKIITDAYTKLLEMGISSLARYVPENNAERLARQLILKTFREATSADGQLGAVTASMRELADRVEGKVPSEDSGVAVNLNAFSVNVSFGGNGAETEVLEEGGE